MALPLAMKSKYSRVSFTSGLLYTLFIRISVLIFFFFQIISCTPVMKIIYGVHQPRYVSDADVTGYAEKLDLQGNIYRLKDYAEENHSKYAYLGKRLPETLVFNAEGRITILDIDCASDLYSIANFTIEAIDSLETGEKSFQDFIADSYIINPLGSEAKISFNTPVYVVKFAEFVGKLNKDHVPEQISMLKNRSDINYVLLNMDYTIPE